MRTPLLVLFACVSCTATRVDAPAPVPANDIAASTPAAVSRVDAMALRAPADASSATTSPTAAAEAVKLPETMYDHFGAGVCDGPVVEVMAALSAPDTYADKDVRLAGPISSVCTKKGCWMRLGDDERSVFVKFKGYAFFVPLDCAGRTAVIEGHLAVEKQSIDEVKHYLEDEGKHDEAERVTDPRTVLSFVATGVAIRKSADV